METKLLQGEMMMKKILIITACFLLILPSFLTIASSESEEETEALPASNGKLASKDEVVYAKLHANGDGEELYIVNSLEVEEAGVVADYGNYTSLKNLTDLSEMKQNGDKIEVTAEEGRFYYQGNIDTELLPWNMNIRYFLDGNEVSPEKLAGATGNVEIKISTSANEEANPIFFENYLLQLTLLLDAEKTTNIESEDGTLANAGKDFQTTFTVMPGEESEVAVAADVVDFSFDGIDIAAVPSNMDIDAPETDELTGEMQTLSNAIAEINDGVDELKNGATNLNQGAEDLRTGSSEYRDGIDALNQSSSELVNGSSAIDEALETMHASLSGVEDIDLSELELVFDGLSELSEGLKEISGGLEELHENYMQAYHALDDAMTAIPAYELSEEEIAALYASDADSETVNQLVEVYTAALTAKGTFDQIKEAFLAVDSTLDTVISSLGTMANQVDLLVDEFSGSIGELDISSGISELAEGVAALSANYKEFHTGLVSYTGGVDELASGYQQLDSGIVELSEGTAEFEEGLTTLHQGTTELDDATSDLPIQMTEEIDQMISEYDKSDFEAISFVSEQNKNVSSVQFVLTTESIKKDEVSEEAEEEEEKSFWQRFLDLFS